MKNRNDLIELMEEALAFLRNEPQAEPDEPNPLLTGPCIAKTRAGNVVHVQRNINSEYKFSCRADGCDETVLENGIYFRDNTETSDYDIVEVIRPLTEQEVLDWQFRGIEPDLIVACEFGYQLPDGFEHSDVGRKEAEAIGLVYLGKAREDGVAELNGELHFFDTSERSWYSKITYKDIYQDSIYAYKPAT